MAMTMEQALAPVARERGQRIVIPTMGAITAWPWLPRQPLDFAYMPSAMGHGPGLGLGLALAHPEHGVIVLNGDGSMLMNLGSLVTLANHPAEVFLIVLDNGMYEITGGQATAGTGHTDFPGLARAAGIRRVHAFADAAAWQQGAAAALASPGPAVIVLALAGRMGQKTPNPPRPMSEQIQALRQALGH